MEGNRGGKIRRCEDLKAETNKLCKCSVKEGWFPGKNLHTVSQEMLLLTVGERFGIKGCLAIPGSQISLPSHYQTL